MYVSVEVSGHIPIIAEGRPPHNGRGPSSPQWDWATHPTIGLATLPTRYSILYYYRGLHSIMQSCVILHSIIEYCGVL